MWRCLKCGEQIDNEFDACWNCGTWRDGAAAVGFRAEPKEREQPAGDSGAAEVAGEQIVELCSAADMVEANYLCDRLEEAGIDVRVVGDFLANTGVGLPLGEATSPRIWVHQRDLARAEKSSTNRATSPKPACRVVRKRRDAAVGDARRAGRRRNSIRRAISLSQPGLLASRGGLRRSRRNWAWQNWTILATYSAVAEGRRVGAPCGRYLFSSPSCQVCRTTSRPDSFFAIGLVRLPSRWNAPTTPSGAAGNNRRPGSRFATTPAIRPTTHRHANAALGDPARGAGIGASSGVRGIPVSVREGPEANGFNYLEPAHRRPSSIISRMERPPNIRPLRDSRIAWIVSSTSGFFVSGMGTSIAIGTPRLVIVICSPCATRSSKAGRWVLASEEPTDCMFHSDLRVLDDSTISLHHPIRTVKPPSRPA